MSEQRAVPEIPEDLRGDYQNMQMQSERGVICVRPRVLMEYIERIATLTAERDALAATLRQGAESDTDLRTRYEALERENVALKAQVARLSAPPVHLMET